MIQVFDISLNVFNSFFFFFIVIVFFGSLISWSLLQFDAKDSISSVRNIRWQSLYFFIYSHTDARTDTKKDRASEILNRIKKKKKKKKKEVFFSPGRAIYDSISFDTHDISLRAFHCQTHRRGKGGGKSVRHFSVRNRVRRVQALWPVDL
jgi:hypothetical protein